MSHTLSEKENNTLTEIVPQYCEVSSALEIIVGKWKPIILLNLIDESPLRFNELRRRIPAITQKMLTKQLRELEEEDIIQRVVYAEVPPRVEYSITNYGKTLWPILNAMHTWGLQHKLRQTNKSIHSMDS